MTKLLASWTSIALLIGASGFATLLLAQEANQPQTQPPTQAQPRSQGQAQPPAKDPAVEHGEKLFQQNCGVCHANDATGGRGPDLIRSPVTAHDVKGDQIGQVIHEGRPDKGMPAMPLGDQEVGDIAAFLHARVAESISSLRVPKVYAVERLLTGNAEAGKAYFNGPGGCSSCHSPKGDLAGVASKHTPIDLQARMLYPEAKLFKNTHTTAIVTLPSGQQMEGHLVHADDFVVGLIDSSGWYRSFERDKVKVELKDGLAAHRELLFKLTQADVHNLFAYIESLK
jgi:cytochrome c oxidase cbb3-type subunit III